MDEVLAGSLLEVVARQGVMHKGPDHEPGIETGGDEKSARIFDGSEAPRTIGKYVPLMERKRSETPEVVNARYAARKGLVQRHVDDEDLDE